MKPEKAMVAPIVTLLRPPVIYSQNSFSVPVTPPVALAYLAATLVANGVTVNVIDAIGEGFDHIEAVPRGRMAQGLSRAAIIERIGSATDILAVSVMFSQEWPFIRDLVTAIRQAYPHLVIIAGGEHVSALPEFSLEDCPALDFCGVGEGEELLLDFVTTLRSGVDPRRVGGLCFRAGNEIAMNPRRGRITALDDLPPPAWDLVPIEVYLDSDYGGVGVKSGRCMPVVASRGCPYQCHFCSNALMWEHRYVMRSCASVISEIEHYLDKYGAEHIEFYDLTAIVKKEWIVEFCRTYLDRKFTFSWSLPTGTRSEALDQEVVSLLSRTNCNYLVYAPESGAEKTLNYINKQISLSAMTASVKIAVNNRINTRCNLIIGFPKEGLADVLETLRFQLKLAWYGVDDVPLYLFSPYPGSVFFDYLRESGAIGQIDDDYFDSLLGQMDLQTCTVYSEEISGRMLRLLRICGMSAFYGLSYLLYPKRIWRSFHNIFIRKRTNTVFEQRIFEKIQRRATNRRE